jgi:hypothetical protein
VSQGEQLAFFFFFILMHYLLLLGSIGIEPRASCILRCSTTAIPPKFLLLVAMRYMGLSKETVAVDERIGATI